MHKKIICCLLFIISIFACVSAYAAEVTDVRWGLDRFNVLRLVVDLDSPPGYNISFQGQTMLVTVNAKLDEKVTRSFKMRSTLAPTMTVEESGGNTVLKLPLARTIGTQDYNAFTLKNDLVTKRPNRLVVDITADKTATPSVVIPKANTSAEKAKAPVTVPKTSTAKTTVPKTTTPKTTAKATVPKKTAVKTEEKKTSKSSFKTDGGLKGKKITLDAGHGGSDPGAIGSNGTREKDVTLKITKKVQELLKKKGYDISEQHSDCGMLIFDPAKQDTGAGGSGCGCAASVLAEYLLPKLENGEWKRILFVPTGALMSKVSFQEGSSVPGIAQAVVIEREEDV